MFKEEGLIFDGLLSEVHICFDSEVTHLLHVCLCGFIIMELAGLFTFRV